MSVPSLLLTLGPFPLPRRDTRRRLHRSSASLYTLYTCRSGFLWGSRGRRSTGVKQRARGQEGGNSTQLKQETIYVFQPKQFQFPWNPFKPQTYIRKIKQATHRTVSFSKKDQREHRKTMDAVGYFWFLCKKRWLSGELNRVYSFASYKWTRTWLVNRHLSPSRCIQHAPGCTEPWSKRGASSWSVIHNFWGES